MAAGVILGVLFFVGLALLIVGASGTEGTLIFGQKVDCCTTARLVLSGAVMMCVALMGGWLMGPWY